jgi:transposase
MVDKWRARFLKARVEGLHDEPRPGAPRKMSDAQVEKIVIQTLEGTRADKRIGPRAAWRKPLG